MSVQLLQGDCLELMNALPSQSIDAILTDPPYGVSFKGSAWDDSIPDWIGEARRVAKVVAFTTGPLTLWMYPSPDWVACWYRSAASSRSLLGGFNHWTPIVIYGKPKIWVDVFKTNSPFEGTKNKGIDHPSPKPIDLMKWLVDVCAPEGGTVLDPFMGSGTTGVACAQTGRSFIGMELRKDYFDAARERIENTQQAFNLEAVQA